MQSDSGINVVVGVVVVLYHREHCEGLLGIECVSVAVGGVFGDSPHLVHVHRGDLQATEVVVLPHRERISLRFGVNEGELEDLEVCKGVLLHFRRFRRFRNGLVVAVTIAEEVTYECTCTREEKQEEQKCAERNIGFLSVFAV